MDHAAAIQSASGIPDHCLWIAEESPAKDDQFGQSLTQEVSIRNRDLRHLGWIRHEFDNQSQ